MLVMPQVDKLFWAAESFERCRRLYTHHEFLNALNSFYGSKQDRDAQLQYSLQMDVTGPWETRLKLTPVWCAFQPSLYYNYLHMKMPRLDSMRDLMH